jgi:putative membrane protein
MKFKALLYTLIVGAAVGLTHSACAQASHHKGSADALFVKKAGAGGLTEVLLGNIAQQNGASQDVKDFGAKMVTDHTTINDNLKALAAKDSLTLPDKPTDDQQALIDKLGKESGKTFDNAYIHAMVKAHIGDKALFTAESANTKNPDLKQFADDSLTVIKEHLGMIQDIAGTHGLAGGRKGGSGMAMSDSGAPAPQAAGDAAMSKSGAGPGGNANPPPVGSMDSTTTTSPGTPPASDAGAGKSGAGPGSTGNPAPGQ